MREFKAGDKVYIPMYSNKVYTLFDSGDYHYPLKALLLEVPYTLTFVVLGLTLVISAVCYFTYAENKSDNEALVLCVQETKQVSDCKLAIQGK